MHPDSKNNRGNALIEAISASCLALAPLKKLWGFPELISKNLDFTNFSELIDILKSLENDNELYNRERIAQANKVQQ